VILRPRRATYLTDDHLFRSGVHSRGTTCAAVPQRRSIRPERCCRGRRTRRSERKALDHPADAPGPARGCGRAPRMRPPGWADMSQRFAGSDPGPATSKVQIMGPAFACRRQGHCRHVSRMSAAGTAPDRPRQLGPVPGRASTALRDISLGLWLQASRTDTTVGRSTVRASEPGRRLRGRWRTGPAALLVPVGRGGPGTPQPWTAITWSSSVVVAGRRSATRRSRHGGSADVIQSRSSGWAAG
jgi:hypothetical protein